MIAPAMNTRPQEALSYRELARQQAQISRQISLTALPRLRELVALVAPVEQTDAAEVESAAGVETVVGSEPAAFAVTLRFSVDDRGFSRVEGELSGRIVLNCNGCAEILAYPLDLSFACIIAESEAVADTLVDDARAAGEFLQSEDVLVANGSEVTVAQIVEDEILLNLPERLCSSDPCERAPELAYPSASGSPDGARTEADENAGSRGGDENDERNSEKNGDENPFSVLAELKLGGRQKED